MRVSMNKFFARHLANGNQWSITRSPSGSVDAMGPGAGSRRRRYTRESPESARSVSTSLGAKKFRHKRRTGDGSSILKTLDGGPRTMMMRTVFTLQPSDDPAACEAPWME